jgi:hypothetical protein
MEQVRCNQGEVIGVKSELKANGLDLDLDLGLGAGESYTSKVNGLGRGR